MNSFSSMRALPAALVLATLAGCGVETASTAATAGAVKKQEIEQGQATQAQMQDSLHKALQANEKRNDPGAQGSP